MSTTRPAKQMSAFEKGLQPAKILAVSIDKDKKLLLKIRWRGTYRSDWVDADEANQLCPLLVIGFYESSELWKGSYPPYRME
ncbi:unnamed protein product [Orchesella dallaii]|uniref:Chromo shadow domain-containing protein n=1 Tax=Orchesella dallaii TaxID=48710 RepID=A0ABP1RP01_9HEXA